MKNKNSINYESNAEINLNSKEKHIKFKIKQIYSQHQKDPVVKIPIQPKDLRSFGDWIYKNLHSYDEYSFLLSKLRLSGFNQFERIYLWCGFEKNIKEDYSNLISFILKEIIKHSKKYKFCPKRIIDTYISQLTESEYVPDFKAYIQLWLADSAMLVMDDIINENISIPRETLEDYKQLCLNLEKYIDFNISTAYVEHLIGKREVFPEAYKLIHDKYFNIKNN